jgi:tRNA-specific 2-thiouridylase
MYVIKVNPETKQVIVGEEEDLFDDSLEIKELNWLGEGANIPEKGIEVEVRFRSLSQRKKAMIKPTGDSRYKVALFEKERAITPGQACVMYDGTRVLGGGWIV